MKTTPAREIRTAIDKDNLYPGLSTAGPAQGNPWYYHDNFRELLVTVRRLYPDVLSSEEMAFIDGFLALPRLLQCLLVRLYGRKGPLLRSDRLHYAELGDDDWIIAALKQLARTGWLDFDRHFSREDVLPLLTRADLLQLFGGAANARLAALQQRVQGDAVQWRHRLPFHIVRPLHGEALQTCKDLFFSQRRQNLDAFVIRELGHIRYPAYALRPDSRYFKDRSSLQALQTLYLLRDSFEEIMAAKDSSAECTVSLSQCLCELADQIPHLPGLHPLRHRADRLRNRIARQLERGQAVQSALQVYECSMLPPARERRARIALQLGDAHACYTLLMEMDRLPVDATESSFVEMFLPRCLRTLRLWPCPGGSTDHRAHVRAAYPATTLTLPARPEHLERAVADALSRAGGLARHVENWLFPAVFGLTIWPALYADVPGAFTHPFQNAPHDLLSPDFFGRRRKQLGALLAGVLAPDWPERVLANWDLHYGTSNPFTGWSEDGRSLLEAALQRIPPHHFRGVFIHLLRDLRVHGSGFPDLLHLPAHGGYELIEVKGPGDQLRPNQRAWLRQFEEQGIPARVLHVEWPASASA